MIEMGMGNDDRIDRVVGELIEIGQIVGPLPFGVGAGVEDDAAVAHLEQIAVGSDIGGTGQALERKGIDVRHGEIVGQCGKIGTTDLH